MCRGTRGGLGMFTDVLSLIMNPMVRRCAVACALVLALCGCSESTGTSGAPAPVAVPPAASSTYTLMQMNLCLSGLAGCYGKTAYPAVVEEAVAQIREADPDAVTLNEVCRTDVARIARRTGYHRRSLHVAHPRAPSPSAATSTVAAPAPPTASGLAPTGLPTRLPGSSTSTEAARSDRPRRRSCRPSTPTTTSYWSARTSPHPSRRPSWDVSQAVTAKSPRTARCRLPWACDHRCRSRRDLPGRPRTIGRLQERRAARPISRARRPRHRAWRDRTRRPQRRSPPAHDADDPRACAPPGHR